MTNKLILPALLALGTLVACGPSEEEYSESMWDITCDKTFECTDAATIEAAQEGGFWIFGADADECYTIFDDAEETDEGEEADCTYDKGAAADCLEAYEAITCDDMTTGLPAVCSDVCPIEDAEE